MECDRLSAAALALQFSLIICAAMPLGGCDKSSSTGSNDANSIALLDSALNPDGSLNEYGLKQIEAHSGDPKISVTFVRTQLSDAGLAQLAKFQNIRRIDALGSRITDKGIAKFKESVPQAEVNK